jgi:L-aspartate oxidase
LRLARNPQRKITIITRNHDPHESNTRYAQGGIIGRSPDDNAELLLADILAAGAGASSEHAARILSEEGPALLQKVLEQTAGVEFDRDKDGKRLWGQEAAHSRRRILHVGDETGKAIMAGLMGALHKFPNIEIETNATAVDLITFPHHSRDPLDSYRPITCHGSYVFDRNEKRVHRFLADVTVLATGGLGRIYRNTTNPTGARGDGLAMAHRAGARIANAEYVQFHPTALAVPGAEGLLISEAVRGEGGVLLTPLGKPFMAEYAPDWKDLAPRDVVARAIQHEMEAHGFSHVLLDIASRMPAEASLFP